MELKDLGQILDSSYNTAPRKEQTTVLFLFGIQYKDHIEKYGVKAVVQEAKLRVTAGTEIHKGMKLAKYVEIK